MATTNAVFGTNITFSLEALKTALMEKCYQEAQKNGTKMPSIPQLLLTGGFHFLDAEGNEIPINRIVITYTE